MLQTGIVLDARYQDHNPGQGHPERTERIGTLLSRFASYKRDGLKRFDPRHATHEELALVHDTSLIGRVAASAGLEAAAFDADTRVSAQSYETALLATGGLLTILDAVMEREVDNGFALVRPPGHHAERNRAMGFCLFNSVAVGAQYLRERFGLSRILVMDWDLHHGNGTQHSFYDDPGVLYLSTHQYPYYPGTGAAEEAGQGSGEGYTVNLPLSAGWGDVAIVPLFEEVIDPICRQFQPEFVLISAGFDAHARDPLGGLTVTEEGFTCPGTYPSARGAGSGRRPLCRPSRRRLRSGRARNLSGPGSGRNGRRPARPSAPRIHPPGPAPQRPGRTAALLGVAGDGLIERRVRRPDGILPRTLVLSVRTLVDAALCVRPREASQR